MGERRLAGPACLIALVGVLLTSGPVEAQQARTVPGPVRIEVAPGAGRGDVAPGAGREVGAEGGVLALDGARRYLDTLEFGGARVVNELSMDDYLAGIAEMPASWPTEALRAQAVAARTYAWAQHELASFEGYDLCASTACQVFEGAEAELSHEDGSRWRDAVEATSGEVLLDDGEPILARYFSTSGGRTYDNDVIFDDDPPRPFLVGVDDPDDAVSPFHRWEVTFDRDDVDEMFGVGETLAAAVPVASIERRGAVDDPDAPIRVTGQDGDRANVSAQDLREFVSEQAPARFGDRYPSERADGQARLPTTLPSSRYAVELDGDEVVFEGRGWGHGVGMGQYGARGKAERGLDHREILASYYGGLQPTTSEAMPERVRVGLELSGTEARTVRGDRAMRIVDGDGDVVEETALGSWRIEPAGADVRLTPPEGTGRELEVGATREADDGPVRRGAVIVATQVNKPALLNLRVRTATTEDDVDGEGSMVLERDLGVVEMGRRRAMWSFEDAGGEPVPAGDYEVSLVATDGQGIREAGESVTVTVPSPDQGRARTGGGGVAWWVVLTAGTLVAVAGAVTARVGRARSQR